MAADVPLGAFLSGGIDSATIVAMMAEESSRPVKTFSIGFEDEAFNELPYARLQAERYGTEHHELMVKPDAAEVLPLLVRHYNEPFADSSALPTYYVSQMTRRHVTVALSGDGGDESFAGYDIYAQTLKWGACDAVPLWLRQMIATGGRALLGMFPNSNTLARCRRGLGVIAADGVLSRFLQLRDILKPEEKRLAYTPRFRGLLAEQPMFGDPVTAFPWDRSCDDLSWMMQHDQNFYLPDCLMAKTDIASMANGLEVRCPFLDHEFVDFAATIPSKFKHDGTSGKKILRRAVTPLLQPEILNKPKTGFAVPVARWFRTELAPLLRENLLDDKSARRGLIEQRLLKRMVTEHIEGRRSWSNRLWAFLFLELWFREFMD